MHIFWYQLNHKKVTVLELESYQRCVILARHIIENNSTVRATAKIFGISKSTVHKDLTERLIRENPALFKEVRKILDLNKSERHIRGGLATKKKYELKKHKSVDSEE